MFLKLFNLPRQRKCKDLFHDSINQRKQNVCSPIKLQYWRGSNQYWRKNQTAVNRSIKRFIGNLVIHRPTSLGTAIESSHMFVNTTYTV